MKSYINKGLLVFEVATTILVLTYFLLPIWWLFVASTKNIGDYFGGNPLWFSRISSINYQIAVTETNTLIWLFNSITISGASALIASLSSAMAGYALSKFNFKGKFAVYTLIAASMMVPSTALALPIFMFMASIRWINTLQAVILPTSVAAFGVYFMRIFMGGAVPDDLLEAARLDGASEFRIFTDIALRMASSGLLTFFMIHFIATWNNFFLPQLMLLSTTKFTLPQGIAVFVVVGTTLEMEKAYAIALAGSVFSIIPLMILFILLEKHIEEGFQKGLAIKG